MAEQFPEPQWQLARTASGPAGHQGRGVMEKHMAQDRTNTLRYIMTTTTKREIIYMYIYILILIYHTHTHNIFIG